MSIVRTRKRENPFVQIDKGFIGNGELSLKATGLLTYILSKPDGWKIRMADIQKRFTDGETSIRSAMKELMGFGYIHRYQDRSEGGKFGEWIYDVYERPEFNPKKEENAPKRENHNAVKKPKRDFPNTVNPNTVNPNTGNHHHSNNESSNNESSNNESSNIYQSIQKYKSDISDEFYDFIEVNIDRLTDSHLDTIVYFYKQNLIPEDLLKIVVLRVISKKKVEKFKAYLQRAIESEVQKENARLNKDDSHENSEKEKKNRNRYVSRNEENEVDMQPVSDEEKKALKERLSEMKNKKITVAN